MPLVYQQNINPTTKLGVWHIEETEAFFLQKVSLQRDITHPHKRLQHLAGRFLLQELYPGFPHGLIRIADTRKPFLENEEYHFSISHCGDYAAIIVSREYRVGVDIELVNNKIERVMHKFLSDEEQQEIDSKKRMENPKPRIRLLTLAWSIKEAMFKWYGKGLVDFKEHMVIDAFSWKEDEGIAHCRFLKDINITLRVHFLFFNNYCISWVLSKS